MLRFEGMVCLACCHVAVCRVELGEAARVVQGCRLIKVFVGGQYNITQAPGLGGIVGGGCRPYDLAWAKRPGGVQGCGCGPYGAARLLSPGGVKGGGWWIRISLANHSDSRSSWRSRPQPEMPWPRTCP